jgi:HK97 family phage portal protein
MRWPWQRRKVELRDFVDLTGFTLGEGLSTPLTAHAALRRISGWIAIACRPVVDRLAGLSWQALSDAGEELEKSPFVDLLRNPNPQQSGGLVLRMIASTLVLSGEAYLIIRRGRRSRRPAELWPVAPSRVARVWADGQLFYDISPGLSQQEPERLRPDDVVRIYRPRPDDLLEPYGSAAMVWDEVLAERGWSKSVRHWFEQDARPAMLLEFGSEDQSLTPDQWERFAHLWSVAQRRRDGQKFGVPMPVVPGGKVREVAGVGASENLGPTELALRNKIMAALGTPGFLVGFAGEANRASAEAALWSFDFSAVAPWAQLIVDAINYQLGDEFAGQRVQFAEWIWRDRLAESEIDERLLAHLVISPNEARAKRNMPPAPWGELPAGQQQDVPYDGTRRPEPPTGG